MNLRRLLTPRRIELELSRLRKKWTAKLLRRDREVLHLPPSEGSEPSGRDVLVSYVLDGVRQALRGETEHSHTHFWESYQIAKTFADLGYGVDVVHWQNTAFQPQKPYRAVVDVRNGLERWQEQLPADTLEIFHGETAHWRFHRDAQAERYERLAERRGVRLAPVKPPEPNCGIETADVGFILGNEFTLGTYEFAETPLYPLSISTTSAYPDFTRDQDSARRFLWFGSGDMVHKGLDLVLEAVATRPHLELTVCGPIHRESAFEQLYEKELYGLPNVHTYGWIDTQSQDFLDIARRSSALIYPSCSEGQCGGVITCMHAGLVPILTEQCGVPVDESYGRLLPDAKIDTIAEALEDHASTDLSTLRSRSEAAAAYARTEHTRAGFAARYSELAAKALGVSESDAGGTAE